MALLLAPFRWLVSSILRLALLAAIVVAAYFLLLKPAIHSGEQSLGRSLHSLERKASPQRLARCISHAGGDVAKTKRCARLF